LCGLPHLHTARTEQIIVFFGGKIKNLLWWKNKKLTQYFFITALVDILLTTYF